MTEPVLCPDILQILALLTRKPTTNDDYQMLPVKQIYRLVTLVELVSQAEACHEMAKSSQSSATLGW